jgi:hypothetical protein
MDFLERLPSEDYKALCDEIKATITEGVFNSRWELLRTYHEVGKLISDYKDITVSRLSTDTSISQRTLERCVQFYEKFPDMEKLPEGKNISWHKIVNHYLPDHKDVTSDESDGLVACPGCGLRFKL